MSATSRVRGEISLRPDRLTVDAWSTDDPSIIRAAARARGANTPLSTWMEACLRSGAAATEVASTSSDLVRAEAALDRLTVGVGQRLDQAMSRLTTSVDQAIDPDSGALAVAVQEQVTRLANGVGKLLLGPEAPVPSQLRHEIQSASQAMLGEIQRVLAAQRAAVEQSVRLERAQMAESVRAVVQGQHAEIITGLAEVSQAVAVAAETRRGLALRTAAGTEFEGDVTELLGIIAADAGDGGATPTGTTAGVDGSKAGDAVVDLATGGRLVVEAKRRSAGMSVDAWRKELARAKKARSADVALGVTAPDLMPVAGRSLLVIGTDLVVAYDEASADQSLLVAAYQVARLLARTSGNAHADTDLGAVRRHVLAVVDDLELLAAAQRQASSMRNAADKLAGSLASIRETIAERVTTVTVLLDGRDRAA